MRRRTRTIPVVGILIAFGLAACADDDTKTVTVTTAPVPQLSPIEQLQAEARAKRKENRLSAKERRQRARRDDRRDRLVDGLAYEQDAWKAVPFPAACDKGPELAALREESKEMRRAMKQAVHSGNTTIFDRVRTNLDRLRAERQKVAADPNSSYHRYGLCPSPTYRLKFFF